MSERFQIVNSDCIEAMKAMAENSVDAVVCDPPYGLEFMGKGWDKGVPGVAYWSQALRVLKPGGHLLAFGGTRTYHRVVSAIEDAGFEIRDCVMWLYGSGFPKSLNLKGDWQGWGTALKPAYEPIVVARKPLTGTVAENVQGHGVGAINIDRCRVHGEGGRHRLEEPSQENTYPENGATNFSMKPGPRGGDPAGRWPANIIHDGSEEVLAAFPDAPGQIAESIEDGEEQGNKVFGAMRRGGPHHYPRNESTKSAARFFYCAKTSKSERGEGNNHPTVKPVALMRYLCRLVCPQNGLILDPFMGSGSTGIAALEESFRFVGIEREANYCEIARQRLAGVQASEPLFEAA